ncbi:hypothetical protein BT63DRAFT_191866 [Microthyrium microscopicum]|uniref:Uncharacterized protein n=1 Tax=Microthyrium microscopicum TaxID=703497 RepID=A0A6A6UKD2_9PEZI|nr:hypothetical protein BT63DRAFT_191866 [Microthyrium microscopicum]
MPQYLKIIALSAGGCSLFNWNLRPTPEHSSASPGQSQPRKPEKSIMSRKVRSFILGLNIWLSRTERMNLRLFIN